jgi:hypothetical protein
MYCIPLTIQYAYFALQTAATVFCVAIIRRGETFRKADYLEVPDVDGRIIFEWIFKK